MTTSILSLVLTMVPDTCAVDGRRDCRAYEKFHREESERFSMMPLEKT